MFFPAEGQPEPGAAGEGGGGRRLEFEDAQDHGFGMRTVQQHLELSITLWVRLSAGVQRPRDDPGEIAGPFARDLYVVHDWPPCCGWFFLVPSPGTKVLVACPAA